ncbi:MAG: AMP nucleosidase, partial [Rhizobacter sp.]|nr:AMP nucleosidase [Chlorobiales bacterium]
MATTKTEKDQVPSELAALKQEDIGRDMLERYTGVGATDLGDYVLLTNFSKYLAEFSKMFSAEIVSGSAFQVVTAKSENISIIDYKIGSPTAALVMDLLSYRKPKPKAVIMLGLCGGLNKRLTVGEYILPIAAIRDDGASGHYMPPRVPALPTFNLQKVLSQVLVENGHHYRTGVIHSTDYRFWEFDEPFKKDLIEERAIAIDMECATLFIAGFAKLVAIGALMLVSDLPFTKHGIKTKASANSV